MDKYIEEQEKAKAEKEVKTENVVKLDEITIEDFAKLDLRVAEVVAAEKVEKADKLLKLTLDLNGATRTVVSGISKWYAPDDLVGASVVVVANLKPVKLRGIESMGMILCAEDDDGNLSIVAPVKKVKSGSKVR